MFEDIHCKAKLERQIAVLESQRKIFYQDLNRQETQLREAENEAKKCEDIISSLEKDWDIFQSTIVSLSKDEKNNPIPKITFVDGLTTEDSAIISERISKIKQTAKTGMGNEKVGEFCGFEIRVKTEIVSSKKTEEGIFSEETENLFSVHGRSPLSNGLPIVYSHNYGRLATDPKLCAAYALNALNKIPTLIDNHKQKLETINKTVKSIKENMPTASTWKKQNELVDLKDQHRKLEQKITSDLNGKNNIAEQPIKGKSKPLRTT